MKVSARRAAVANLRGRAGSTLSVLMIVGALIAGLWALVIPLRDVTDNVARHFSQDAWQDLYLVHGIDGAQDPMSPAEVKELRGESGVEDMTPVVELSGSLQGGEHVTVREPVPGLEAPVVTGREPHAGACEAMVSRDWPGARLGQGVRVRLTGAGPRSTVEAPVVGIIERGFPLFDGETMVMTCPLPGGAASETYLVRTEKGASLPRKYVAETVAQAADRSFSGRAATGMLGLVVLLLAAVAAVVLVAVGRWTSRARRSELATLSVWGATRARLIAMVMVEGAVLAAGAAMIGGVAGTALAWWIVRQGGPTGLVDPAAGLWAATPSVSTVALVVLPVTAVLIVAMTSSSALTLRKPVATLLRRSGE